MKIPQTYEEFLEWRSEADLDDYVATTENWRKFQQEVVFLLRRYSFSLEDLNEVDWVLIFKNFLEKKPVIIRPKNGNSCWLLDLNSGSVIQKTTGDTEIDNRFQEKLLSLVSDVWGIFTLGEVRNWIQGKIPVGTTFMKEKWMIQSLKKSSEDIIVHLRIGKMNLRSSSPIEYVTIRDLAPEEFELVEIL